MTAQVRGRTRLPIAPGPQRLALLPLRTPPPRPAIADTMPAHQPGSGTQVRGTLHLVLERLRPTLVLSARQPRDEPDQAARPAHQRLINRREHARSQTAAPARNTISVPFDSAHQNLRANHQQGLKTRT
jgi:hypothetical protein